MDGDKFYDDLMESMRRGAEHADEMSREFAKLAVEPTSKRPELGDRVLVAIGLLNMGHLWIREEATVIEVGDTSFHVEFKDRKEFGTREPQRKWVHQALITDVLARPQRV